MKEIVTLVTCVVVDKDEGILLSARVILKKYFQTVITLSKIEDLEKTLKSMPTIEGDATRSTLLPTQNCLAN